ncbi:GIY-YIG nuclease family protein [Candidatus Peregrinibacteria bacterium]|nr:GIY-YIG nuclease family protein [Candidatus Peregrinibacteria bacterium]
MYYTYVLQSLRDEKLYIGFTRDLRKRLVEHQEGKVESTKTRRPFRILFYEAFHLEEDALGRERYFKTTKGKVALKKMLRRTLQPTCRCDYWSAKLFRSPSRPKEVTTSR